ncbi:MAG TPA: anthranilate phosphoribosyltransferase [Desulfohalobiaceae bacterium]|nr:anthranilate phosphoribosyltransferase [Desulfohalobiaceae bacterium]
MSINLSLELLSQKQNLHEDRAYRGFQQLFSQELSPAQAGAFLLGLSTKGETSRELKAAVRAALDHSRLCPYSDGPCIDTCGTGGDGRKSFNCSTAVALFLADMGHKVVKHGNRAVSSKCGSADIIESLEIPFLTNRDQIFYDLDKTNFVFLFAPYFHPAFSHLSQIRKELGIPTLFNLMGPLLNPVRPTHQLIGVGKKKLLPLMANALALDKDIKNAVVVHGACGFDEITPCGISQVIYVHKGKLTHDTIDPNEFDIPKHASGELSCRDKTQALEVMRSILRGHGPQAIQDMVILNLGLALSLLENDKNLQQCIQRAKEHVHNGLIRSNLYA